MAYEDVQTVVAAALKLQPFDPSQAVTWAVRAEAEVERLVGDTAGLTATEQIPAHGAPLVEEWGQRHELATRRLFRA
jgi:urease accessory protein